MVPAGAPPVPKAMSAEPRLVPLAAAIWTVQAFRRGARGRGRLLRPGQLQRLRVAERVEHLQRAADGCGAGRRRRQVGDQRDLGGGDRAERGLADLDRRHLRGVQRAAGPGDPAVQHAPGAVHEVAVVVEVKIPGAGVLGLRVECPDAVGRAGFLADGEEALSADGQVQRLVGLRHGALHSVDVVRPGHDGTRLVDQRCAGSEIVLERGIDALEADRLAVGDVVADVAERGRLGRQPADRGIHGAEQRHMQSPDGWGRRGRRVVWGTRQEPCHGWRRRNAGLHAMSERAEPVRPARWDRQEVPGDRGLHP